ncbi:MAG: D-glycerate dehydrogenase [Pseudomonadota bacterium]
MAAKPRILVTRRLPAAVEDRLRSEFDATLSADDAVLSPAALAEAWGAYDGLLTSITEGFDADLIARPGRVRILSNFAVGVNNIDLAAAKEAGIAVGNTPDVLTDATAEIALLLILASLRRMREAEEMLRQGRWQGFAPTMLLGAGLGGRTLGIVGMGRIGQAVAKRAEAGFGMKILYFNRSPVTPPVPAERAATIEEVMARADVVSLHIPGGPETRGLISAALIGRMKPTAHLVNTARGDVVDEPALIAALAEGRIAGAGLDVYAAEPEVPEALQALPNVTLLPHIGSATVETRTAMGMLAVDNLAAFFAGEEMPARVV